MLSRDLTEEMGNYSACGPVIRSSTAEPYGKRCGAEVAGEQVGSRVYKTVTTYAKEGYDKATTAVKTAYHAVAKAATSLRSGHHWAPFPKAGIGSMGGLSPEFRKSLCRGLVKGMGKS